LAIADFQFLSSRKAAREQRYTPKTTAAAWVAEVALNPTFVG
jgi:hypothetical protein